MPVWMLALLTIAVLYMVVRIAIAYTRINRDEKHGES